MSGILATIEAQLSGDYINVSIQKKSEQLYLIVYMVHCACAY